MKTTQEILEKKATEAIIFFGKSGDRLPTAVLTVAVNEALAIFSKGCNNEYIIAHRVIAAKKLIINAIYALSREQIKKVNTVVPFIAQHYQ